MTERPDFAGAGLPAYRDLVFGGHDVVGTPLEKRAELLADGGVLPHRLVEQVRGELRAADAEVRPGYEPAARRAAGRGGRAAGGRPGRLPRAARAGPGGGGRRRLHRAAAPAPAREADSVAGAGARRWPDGAPLPPSSLYAWAAFTAGCSVRGLHPVGRGAAAGAGRAGRRRPALPWAGNDGKTGETLVKTALAPMFASRALRVRSWAGVNLLGGGDGANLADPEVARSKLASKGLGARRRCSATRCPGRCTSTTSPTWGSGRRPGTTCRSRASSAPG